ncbi:MAG TPA: coenzyme F420-0:L-glutamate ligase [Candidatus Saccharimonadales bacterium]|nr:coenzyme F420-0:L-glutamate ligase [Candidatus Saccharimonadales bacterium]
MTSTRRIRRTNRPVTIIPVRLQKVQPSQPLAPIIIQALEQRGLTPQSGDVISVASKIASIAEGQIVKLQQIQPSKLARKMAAKWKIDSRLMQVILNESDDILAGVEGFALTIRQGILTPNAGIDQKNSPPGTVTLWPKDPDLTAERLRRLLQKRFHARLGVQIVDSRITPLRMGTIGLAIGISGFAPIRDERGKQDLYGRLVRATRADLADDIASASHLVMGERNEHVGLVLIRGARVQLGQFTSKQVLLTKQRCLITSNFQSQSIVYGRPTEL